MPVLVAVRILKIDHGLAVFGPEILADAALLVSGDYFVVILSDRLDPDLQNVLFIGRNPGEPFAVRRELRGNFLGVAKKDVPRYQRRKVRPSLSDLSQTKSEKDSG